MQRLHHTGGSGTYIIKASLLSKVEPSELFKDLPLCRVRVVYVWVSAAQNVKSVLQKVRAVPAVGGTCFMCCNKTACCITLKS